MKLVKLRFILYSIVLKIILYSLDKNDKLRKSSMVMLNFTPGNSKDEARRMWNHFLRIVLIFIV